MLDIGHLRARLGYRDVVPAREAVAQTARWLAANPLAAGAPEEHVLTDPFDYGAEDQLIDAWHKAMAGLPAIRSNWPMAIICSPTVSTSATRSWWSTSTKRLTSRSVRVGIAAKNR